MISSRPLIVALCSLTTLLAPAAEAQVGSAQDQTLAQIASVVPSVVVPQHNRVLALAAAKLVNPNEVKGYVGEALAHNARLFGVDPRKTYRHISSRQGRQGIDSILQGMDSKGRPTEDLLCIESKFNKSAPTLNRTNDGFQGSQEWLKPRLEGQAKHYSRFAQARNVQTGLPTKQLPAATEGAMRLELPDGSKGWVWQDGDGWKTTFPPEKLGQVQAQAGRHALGIRRGIAAGPIKSTVMWTRPVSGGYEIKVYEIPPELKSSKQVSVNEVNLKLLSKIHYKPNSGPITKAAIDGIAKDIARQNPTLTEKACKDLAKAALREGEYFHETVAMQRWQQVRTLAGFVAVGVAVPAAFMAGEVALDLMQGNPVNWWRGVVYVGAGSAGALAGVAAGVLTSSLAVEQPFIANLLTSAGRVVGLSQLATFRLAGGFVGGSVGSTVTAVVLAVLGEIRWEDAGAMAAIGVASAGAVIATEAAVLGAVMAWGTASTGTAIGSLSGAAAMNASLAWLGGGAVSAGGGGIAVGATVMTAGLAVVGIAASYVFYRAWEAVDVHSQLEAWIAYLRGLSGTERGVLRESPAWFKAMVVQLPP
jgi:hypothetical protein